MSRVFHKHRFITFVAFLLAHQLSFAQFSQDNFTPLDRERIKESAQAHTELASNYFGAEQLMVAKEELNKALSIQSDYAPALYLYGIIMMNEQDYGSATSYFNKALSSQPQDVDSQIALGIVSCKQKKHTEGLTRFNNLLRLPTLQSTQRANILINQGLCLQQIPDYKQAQQKFMDASVETPNNPTAIYQLANNYYLTGDFVSSAKQLNKFHQQFPFNASTLYLQWLIYRDVGNSGKMQDTSDLIFKHFPNSAQAKKIQQFTILN